MRGIMAMALCLTALAPSIAPTIAKDASMQNHPYIGMWITEDGQIRHNLLPDNRYDEARGSRESAYQGRYEVSGDHIEYWDDTGFTANGDFIDGVLYHGGMIFYRDGRKGK